MLSPKFGVWFYWKQVDGYTVNPCSERRRSKRGEQPVQADTTVQVGRSAYKPLYKRESMRTENKQDFQTRPANGFV